MQWLTKNPLGLKQLLRDSCHIFPSMLIINPRGLSMVFMELLKVERYSGVVAVVF